jgi:LisH domain-containing protein ARMC9
MIKWIARVLRNEGDQLSDYSIEYATALLMNLSLRAAGKDKCEDPQIELLKVLNDLVEHDNLQVRTYVNGTLYSIFTRKKLREEAKELGMPEVLQYLMQQSDEQFKRQIQYILDQLNNQGDQQQQQEQPSQPEEDFDDEEDDDDDDEEDDEEDIVEEEEGEFNDIIDEQGIMVGEDLLVSEFVGSQEEGVQQIRTVQMMMDRDRQRRMQQNNGTNDN